MVNNGASGACHACKQRHKKCDETRPSCLRCSRAHRTCPGYKVDTERKFINYVAESDCDLLRHQPARLFHPSTHVDELDWPSIEQNALLAFYTDYCVTSSNQNLSRGYLNGLQSMISKAGPTSEVAKACTIIALANLGKKAGNLMLIQTAENIHFSLLRSFRLSISNEVTFVSEESLITAVLLGMYEIIISTNVHYNAHITHAHGVSAILMSKFSPFNLVCGGKLFQLASHLSLKNLEIESSSPSQLSSCSTKKSTVSPVFSILCTPCFNWSNLTMDTIFTQTESLVQRAMTLLASEATIDQLHCLMRDAEQLKEKFYKWPEGLPEEWRPKLVGVISYNNDNVLPPVGYWSGTISSFYDPYVASIWNSYRKAHLLVFNVIMECQKRINSPLKPLEVKPASYKEIEGLINDIVSSIPFLLSADLPVFLENAKFGTPPIAPGRPVGGLLLMHALYVLLTMPVVDSKLQGYLRDCLEWIGHHMGIGQATVLSKCTAIDLFDYVMEAHVLIWAGMLI